MKHFGGNYELLDYGSDSVHRFGARRVSRHYGDWEKKDPSGQRSVFASAARWKGVKDAREIHFRVFCSVWFSRSGGSGSDHLAGCSGRVGLHSHLPGRVIPRPAGGGKK